MTIRGFTGFCAALIVGAAALGGAAKAAQDDAVAGDKTANAGTSCVQFAPPKRDVGGKPVGVEQCLIVEDRIIFNAKGQRYHRVEVWLGGSAEGWAITTKGPRANYFTDEPGFVFVQSGTKGTPVHGIGHYGPPTRPAYEDPDGHGLTVFYPDDPKAWNGKLFVTVHGAGSYAKVGELVPRDPFPARAAKNFYIGLMIDRGYAVVHTKRSSALRGGDVTVTLDDGQTVKGYNVSSNADMMLSWIGLAKSFVAGKLGHAPQRTYLYGHSAGAMLGRLINYGPGKNRGADGRMVVDGFLMDDAGGGMWLPRLMRDGKDVLFAGADDRRFFARQIDVTHMLYLGETGDYLEKKRENTRLLADKSLSDRHRYYEVHGVSHFDANYVATPQLARDGVDMGGVFASLIDRLDEWVEENAPPPADHADAGGAMPAISLPETACPLGVYHANPASFGDSRRGGQVTDFATFDGVNPEPLDGRGKLVDMNGDGKRDRRETVTEAWRRLGLLKPGQSFDRSHYVACVAGAVSKLVGDGLLPESLAGYYVERAATRSLATVVGATH